MKALPCPGCGAPITVKQGLASMKCSFCDLEVKPDFEATPEFSGLDEKQLILLKQGKGFFHIGASGHEAVEVAAAKSMKAGYDYAYPYYRDQAFCLSFGMTSKEILKTMQEFYNGPLIVAEDLMKFEVGDEVKVITKANT